MDSPHFVETIKHIKSLFRLQISPPPRQAFCGNNQELNTPSSAWRYRCHHTFAKIIEHWKTNSRLQYITVKPYNKPMSKLTKETRTLFCLFSRFLFHQLRIQLEIQETKTSAPSSTFYFNKPFSSKWSDCCSNIPFPGWRLDLRATLG